MYGDVQISDLRNPSGGMPGNVVKRLLANDFDVRCLRTNDSLQYEEWKKLDEVVMKAAQKRLLGVGDLLSRNLRFDLDNALGTMVLMHQTESDMNDAEVDMTGKARAKNDAVKYELGYLPIPIIHKFFEINARKLMASRNSGQPLDVTQGALASRKVSEMAEKLLFTGGSNLEFGNGTIYGYIDHPNRITGTLSCDWGDDSSAVNGANVLKDVKAMKQALVNKMKFGPYVIYVPTTYDGILGDDYNDNYGGTTIRDRILMLDGIEDIKVADIMSDDNVAMVQMDEETVRMVMGMEPTPVEWESGDDMTLYHKVMAIMVPQIRADSDGNTGIAHYNI